MIELFIKTLHKIRSEFYVKINIIRLYHYKNIHFQRHRHPVIKGSFGLSIAKNSVIRIGNNLLISSGDNHNPLARNIQSNITLNHGAILTIGDNVGISCSSIRCHKNITIGNNVNIGADCIIMDSDAHSINYKDRRDSLGLDKKNKIDKPIIIEDDVLIGTRCIIMKGVTIGARSIIGAGSVVTKNIPSDCIAAGNPAKVIKYL